MTVFTPMPMRNVIILNRPAMVAEMFQDCAGVDLAVFLRLNAIDVCCGPPLARCRGPYTARVRRQAVVSATQSLRHREPALQP